MKNGTRLITLYRDVDVNALGSDLFSREILQEMCNMLKSFPKAKGIDIIEVASVYDKPPKMRKRYITWMYYYPKPQIKTWRFLLGEKL